jgi:hypothetical protein
MPHCDENMSASLPSGVSFRDVVVVPYSDLLDRWRDGAVHRGGPIWPDWDTQVGPRHCRGGRPVDTRPPTPEGPLGRLEACAWGGAIADAFGHQVADFSMRLLATLASRPDLPIAWATRPDLGWASVAAAPRWFSGILDWFGVPADRTRIVTTPVRVDELSVVPQAEQLGGPGPEPGYLDALDELTGRRLGPRTPEERLLYVSRAGMGARFAGEPYLEQTMAAAGARILRPEQVPLTDQLRAYRDSARIVFAEGSALHGLQLLGRTPAEVSVLERRPGTRLAAANLEPRLRSLAYEDVGASLVHGLLPTGRPDLPHGLSVVAGQRMVEAFGRAGLDLGARWREREWLAARDRDVLTWVAAQAAQPARAGPGSVERILAGLEEAGLQHLVGPASDRLEPLRARVAASVRRADDSRPTLLFMHLPRTAGGAVREALREAVPEAERAEVYDHAVVPGALAAASFAALPEPQRDRLRLVVGDFAYGFHRSIPRPARYATMLRHPVGRVISMYRAAARAAAAGGQRLPELESWVFDARRREADNGMVRAIAGQPAVPFGGCTPALLEEALEHVAADFEVVLVRGSMERSAVLLGRVLGVVLPSFPVTDPDPLGEGEEGVDRGVRKRLRQLNEFDVALFRQFADDF